MNTIYDERWDTVNSSGMLWKAVIVSLTFHLVGALAFTHSFAPKPKPPKRLFYEVQFLSPTPPEPKNEAKVLKAPEPEPEEKPKKKKPEIKIAKKTEPKPKPKPKPKVKAKSKPKPEPKPPPEAKPKPKPKPKPEPKKKLKVAAAKTGVQIKHELPSLLNSWGRLVQRKVEKYWTVPGGIRLREEDDDEALVSFWVDRSGNLMGPPEIVKHATNRSLGESGVRAIKLAAPLPPLPIEFAASEQQVVYAFGLVR